MLLKPSEVEDEGRGVITLGCISFLRTRTVWSENETDRNYNVNTQKSE